MKKRLLLISGLLFIAAMLCGSAFAESSWNPGTKVPQNTVIAGSNGAGTAPVKPRALVSADLPIVDAAHGGTGVANSGTFTFSGSGTLATGGFTLTVPATGTAALLGTANVFTAANTFQNTVTIKDAAGTGAGVLKLQDTTGGQFISIATASNEAADRTVTIPPLGANTTLPMLELAQTFSGVNTFSSSISTDTINGNTATTLAINGKVGASSAGNPVTITAGAGNGAFNGGAASLVAGASGAGATGAGGQANITAGNAASTNGAGGDVVITPGTKTGSGFQGQCKIKGSDGNTDAGAGNVGEYLSSSQLTVTLFPATTQFGNASSDAVTLALTAGDWDVSLVVSFTLNGATCTTVAAGIGTATGNASTGLQGGDNYLEASVPAAVGGTGITISGYRVKVTATTNYYLKVMATYSAGTPQWRARLSARRVR